MTDTFVQISQYCVKVFPIDIQQNLLGKLYFFLLLNWLNLKLLWDAYVVERSKSVTAYNKDVWKVEQLLHW